jgi:hypothetical protein
MEEDIMLETFLCDYSKAIRLIQSSDETGAKTFFNSRLIPSYKTEVNRRDSILRDFLPYFIEMNEFLNNPAVKVSGLVKKEAIIGEYYSDFQDVLLNLRKRRGTRNSSERIR